MKTAKRFFALMLAVLMVSALCTTAFAVNSDDPSELTGSITITNPQDDVDYTAYRIFDLSYTEPNAGVPTDPTTDPGNPYYYSLNCTPYDPNATPTPGTCDNPFYAVVKAFILENKDENPAWNGIELNPVYDTSDPNKIKAYNVSFGKDFDPAKFAEYVKKAIDGDDTVTPPVLPLSIPAGYKADFEEDDATGLLVAKKLPFGYWLVEPSKGALCTLTSTDPDVEVTDKNERPPVDKSIEITPAPAAPEREYVDDTDPKYTAYQLFQKNSRWEWGDDIDGDAFVTAAMAYENPTGTFPLKDAFLKLTYNDAEYSANPGDSAAHLWYELYKNDTYKAAMNEIFMTDADADGTPDCVKGSGKNALNKLTPSATYLVEKAPSTGAASYGVYVAAADGSTDPKPGYLAWGGDAFLVKPNDLNQYVDLDDPVSEVDTNSANIGDTIHYKLVAKVPDMTGYSTYFYTVNDLMDESLTFNNDVVVTLDGVTLEAGLDKDYTVKTRVTEKPVYGTDGEPKWLTYTQEEIDASKPEPSATDPNPEPTIKAKAGDIKIDTAGNPMYEKSLKKDADGNQVYKKDEFGNYLDASGDITTTPSEYVPEYEMITEIRIVFNDMVEKYWNSDKSSTATPVDKTGAPIVIRYSATLNEKTTIFDPNSNNSNVEYSNNPGYVPDSGTETPTDKNDPRDPKWKHNDPKSDDYHPLGEGPTDGTNTYVTELELTKTDESGTTTLPGAKFQISGESMKVVMTNKELFQEDAAGEYWMLKDGTYTKEEPSDPRYTYTPYTADGYTMEPFSYIGLYYVEEGKSPAADAVKITDQNENAIPEKATLYKDPTAATPVVFSRENMYVYDSTNNKYLKIVPNTTVTPGADEILDKNVPANATVYDKVYEILGLYYLATADDFTAVSAVGDVKKPLYANVGTATDPVYEQVNVLQYFLSDGAGGYTRITNSTDIDGKTLYEQKSDGSFGALTMTDYFVTGADPEEVDTTNFTDMRENLEEDKGVFYSIKTTYSHGDYDSLTTKYKKVTVVTKDTDPTTEKFQTSGYVDDNGVLVFSGLGEGTYTIEELIAPDGYNKLAAPITVKITFTQDPADENKGTFSATVDDGDSISADGKNTISFKVVNKQGVELPETGGIGTYLFYTIGGLLVVAAGVLLITKKRMHAGEVED